MLRTVLTCSSLVVFLVALPFAHAQDGGAPVATVNGVPITQSTFEKALRGALGRGGADTPELREAVKNQLIARELFAQEAKKRNLDSDPRVAEAVDQARTNAMVRLYLSEAIKPEPVTDADLRAQYEKIKASLGPEEYKLRIIVTHDKAQAEEALSTARQGRSFSQLAQQYSTAPTARRGGELNWVSFKSPAQEGKTNGLPLVVAQAVERMKPGDISDLLSFNNQWLIVQLEEKRPTVLMTFEQAKPALQKMLTTRAVERATNDLVRSLASSAKITR